MAYTPQLSYRESCTLRRIAWHLGLPMTKALSAVLQAAAERFSPREVCETCRDHTRCADCVFNHEPSDHEGRL
jgi:hypothetical protein